MAKTNSTSRVHISVRQIVFVALTLVALYVIVPQLDQFAYAFQAAKSANISLLICAGIAIMGAVSAAAMVYVCLAFKPIKYSQSLLVQAAGMFVNRLLPAGIGGMGLSADFLYRHGHSLSKAGTIVLINNVLTSLGHLTLLLGAIIFLNVELPVFHTPEGHTWLFGIIALLIVVAFGLLLSKFKKMLRQFIKDLGKSLAMYRTHKSKLLGAYVFALGNTLGHTSAIALSMFAFGLDLSPFIALVVLTGGVAAASVTPTPGGIVGSEAGLTAVLVAYGVETGTALAVALSYRLVSYWLPLLPGAVAFWFAQKQKII
jgi:uncharacterized protein (TIRG00374 family)